MTLKVLKIHPALPGDFFSLSYGPLRTDRERFRRVAAWMKKRQIGASLLCPTCCADAGREENVANETDTYLCPKCKCEWSYSPDRKN